MGLFDLCQRMCVRSGTHTGFVGKQSALDTLADGHFEGIPDTAADDRIRHEGIFKDHADRGGQEPDPDKKNHKTADQIQACHDRYDFFRH